MCIYTYIYICVCTYRVMDNLCTHMHTRDSPTLHMYRYRYIQNTITNVMLPLQTYIPVTIGTLNQTRTRVYTHMCTMQCVEKVPTTTAATYTATGISVITCTIN